MWYLYLITVGMVAAYYFLYFLFPIFFNGVKIKLTRKSFPSLIYIIIFSLLVYLICANINNIALSDRILHIFGGGFLAFFVCFLAVKDSALKINRLQFFILSALIVTALGVLNELIEFFLQSSTGIIFAPSITDTWLDLASNTVGIFLAILVLWPIKKK